MCYKNIFISKNAKIGKNVTICEGVIIEENVCIGDNCYIDYGAVIKSNVSIGEHTFIGANCILGEFLSDFFDCHNIGNHKLEIGAKALIRSGSIIYGDSVIGDNFSSGHRVTIRENAKIGSYVSIGTLSDIQGDCKIGDYVRCHSNVHIGQKTSIDRYVWVFPYVVFTNDPTPPSNNLKGITVNEFACICTGSVLLPGIKIGRDALVGAGAIVTRDVGDECVVVGNPAKKVCTVRDIKDVNGDEHYPWRFHFDRGMPWESLGFQEWCEHLEWISNTHSESGK